MRIQVGLIALAAALLCGGAASAAAAGPRLPGPDLPARSSTGPTAGRASTAGGLSRSKLRHKLARLAKQAPGSSGFYVYDVGARRGRHVLFDRKQGKRRKLASNTKLFTTATALHRLGAGGRISTVVRSRGKRRRRRPAATATSTSIGGGDPTLGSGGLRSLAKQVKRAGIKRIEGRVFADDSIFDRKRGVPDSGFGPSPYIAPLSGLVYERLHVRHGSGPRRRPPRSSTICASAGSRSAARSRSSGRRSSLAGREPVAEVRSPTIAAIVEATNKPSNNFYAEMLLKRLWATPSRRGTTKGGTKAVERFARAQGSKISQLDGSGLSDNNRSSPRDVVRLLVAMRKHRAHEAFYDSLPEGGQGGNPRRAHGGDARRRPLSREDRHDRRRLDAVGLLQRRPRQGRLLVADERGLQLRRAPGGCRTR